MESVPPINRFLLHGQWVTNWFFHKQKSFQMDGDIPTWVCQNPGPTIKVTLIFQRTSKCGGFWFCHFMPLQVAYATSSGVCHFEWRMPLRVAYATSSGVCHFKWHMPLRVAYATSSGVCHFEWRVPLRVACATSSGVCHFEWRVPLRVACATSSGVLTV